MLCSDLLAWIGPPYSKCKSYNVYAKLDCIPMHSQVLPMLLCIDWKTYSMWYGNEDKNVSSISYNNYLMYIK